MVGICLGSQLLAAAAGASVYPNTRSGPDGQRIAAREVGWGPIDLHNLGEPALAGLPAQPLVVHWHGDTIAAAREENKSDRGTRLAPPEVGSCLQASRSRACAIET